jgi:hypothetical protein
MLATTAAPIAGASRWTALNEPPALPASSYVTSPIATSYKLACTSLSQPRDRDGWDHQVPGNSGSPASSVAHGLSTPASAAARPRTASVQPQPLKQRPAGHGSGDEAGRQRQQRQRGLVRATVLDELEEQADEEGEPGQGGEERRAEDQPGGEGLVQQRRRLDERAGRVPLADREGRELDGSGGQAAGRAAVQPPAGPWMRPVS